MLFSEMRGPLGKIPCGWAWRTIIQSCTCEVWGGTQRALEQGACPPWGGAAHSLGR